MTRDRPLRVLTKLSQRLPPVHGARPQTAAATAATEERNSAEPGSELVQDRYVRTRVRRIHVAPLIMTGVSEHPSAAFMMKFKNESWRYILISFAIDRHAIRLVEDEIQRE